MTTKLTGYAAAEAYRRSHRCPACKGSLVVQSDEREPWMCGRIECLMCGRVAVEVEYKEPVDHYAKLRSISASPGRPRTYNGATPCARAECDKTLTPGQERRAGSYCSHECSVLARP